jgi:hypothetical protein
VFFSSGRSSELAVYEPPTLPKLHEITKWNTSKSNNIRAKEPVFKDLDECLLSQRFFTLKE